MFYKKFSPHKNVPWKCFVLHAILSTESFEKFLVRKKLHRWRQCLQATPDTFSFRRMHDARYLDLSIDKHLTTCLRFFAKKFGM